MIWKKVSLISKSNAMVCVLLGYTILVLMGLILAILYFFYFTGHTFGGSHSY
jgi:hypothetical protein